MAIISDYLVFRIQMRAKMPSLTKAEVDIIWNEAEPLPDSKERDDERRYSEEHNIILIKNDGIVKTVFDCEHINRFHEGKLCQWCACNTSVKQECRKCSDRLLESEEESQ